MSHIFGTLPTERERSTHKLNLTRYCANSRIKDIYYGSYWKFCTVSAQSISLFESRFYVLVCNDN